MNFSRAYHTLRLWTIPSAYKRTNYLRKKHIFGAIGPGCTITERKVPLYPQLIRLGSNVRLAANVLFIPHDITHKMLNMSIRRKKKAPWVPLVPEGQLFQEVVGCIQIGNNVFVGSNTTILYDVKIGNNVIIGAGSLVNRDIPDNCVAAGVPARVICDMDTYIQKRLQMARYPDEWKAEDQKISPELVKWCWEEFERRRT